MIDSADFTELGFVKNGANASIDYWAPDPISGYSEACAAGRRYGEQLHTYMKRTGNPMLFGSVLRAMTAKGVYDAVEIGFCGYFGVALLGLTIARPQPETA